MPINNFAENIHKDSKDISLHTDFPILNTPFSSAVNYSNKNGKHPLPGDVLNPKDIVFSKEELDDNNWLILWPSPPIPAFKTEVTKILNYFIENNIRIIIISKAGVKNYRRETRRKNASDLKEKLRLEKRLNEVNYKMEEFEGNPLKIPDNFIKAKYTSLNDFLNARNIYEKHASDYEPKITSEYKNGDEIWHYFDFDNSRLGLQKELFLLIRNNIIVCSPLIRSRLVLKIIKPTKLQSDRDDRDFNPTVKARFSSIKELEPYWLNKIKEYGFTHEEAVRHTNSNIYEIYYNFMDGDEIVHYDDFGIAPRLCEREFLLIRRNGEIVKSVLIRMS